MYEYKTLKSLTSYLQVLVEGRLWLKVIIALFIGVGAGLLLSPANGIFSEKTAGVAGNWLSLPGVLFMKLVQMIMVPLIVASIVSGIMSNNVEGLRRMGPAALLYFVFTTFLSVALGIVLSLAFQPGKSLHKAQGAAATGGDMGAEARWNFDALPNYIGAILPDNPLASMVSGEMLRVVIFAILIGIAALSLNEKHRRPIETLLGAIQEICMAVVKWAMKIVPLAVFGIFAQLTAKIGLESLTGVGYYVLVVLLGLAILLLFYAAVVRFSGGGRVWHFFSSVRDVQLLAFSTTSSAAVMPLSLKTAEEKLGVRPAISNFIIPVGATVNMDGTAIYQCISTLFIAQAYGIELGIPSLILITFTLIAASIGTPSVPGGGVIVLASVLNSSGIPSEGIVLIIGIERLLGMFRAAVNVTGDLAACMFLNNWFANRDLATSPTTHAGS
ncbi:MAG: dicarboxylate/amino acid:cation symporter [Saprospiraceae bacterium]